MQIEELEKLVRMVGATNLGELTLREGESRVTIRKSPKGAYMEEWQEFAEEDTGALDTEIAEDAASDAMPESYVVAAPLVGFFHHAKSPIGAGMQVKVGQIVGVIEAMKLMNEIRSEREGTVQESLIEDGMSVEYGQPLFLIAPTD